MKKILNSIIIVIAILSIPFLCALAWVVGKGLEIEEK